MINELQKLGLTRNESNVYLSLLELGSTTAGSIIKKTKLHRNIVYDNLDKLIEKGLVSFVIIKNTKYFETTSPKGLEDFIQKQKQKVLEKEQIMKKILPKIKKQRKIKGKQEATIFKGKKALKTILEEMTDIKDEILVLGTGWGMRETMSNYYEQWHLKLRKQKIQARILLPLDNQGEFLPPFRTRYLPEENILPSTIAVFEDKVLTIVWDEKEPIAVLIISEKIATSYKNYFNLLWKIAKK